jgi:uncharacterized protein
MLSNSILWKCSGKSEELVYLFGTAHVYDNAYLLALDSLCSYLSDVKVFLAEISLGTLDGLDVFSSKISVSNIFPYSIKKQSAFSSALKQYYGFNAPNLLVLNPFEIVHSIQNSLLPSDSEVFADLYLWNLAQSYNLECLGMETHHSQRVLMDKLAKETSWSEVKRIVSNPTRYRKGMKQMLSDYEKQRLVALYKKSRKSLGNMKRSLLTERNHIMLEAILSNSTKGNVFAAMGAAHLPGRYGLLALLKRNGFKCKPLPFTYSTSTKDSQQL